MNASRMSIISFCLAVLAMTTAQGCREQASTPSANAASSFTLTSLEGKTVSLSDFKGKVVLLNFWATWCPPCRAEIPDLIALQKEYGKRGLVILGISVDQGGVEGVRSFVNTAGINYTVLSANRTVVKAYGPIRGIPTSFLVDREGNIADRFSGYREKAVFEGAIRKLL